nr:MAG TPA: hypothetical protein [Caudoviricetes sp.]
MCRTITKANQIRFAITKWSAYIYLCGKFTSHSSCAIVIGHWQNPVPGLVSRITTEAHMPHKRFFYV